MSHDRGRKPYFGRERSASDRQRDWERQDYKAGMPSRKRSRSLTRSDLSKRRSRSPRKNDKDAIDDNILSEISKLPDPSELWESNQFHEGSGYSRPAMQSGGFTRETSGSYAGNYQPSYAGIYDDFPPVASAPPQLPPAPEISSWNQMALPPPPPSYNPEDKLKKEAAIETEMRHQKAALCKQREDYIKKSAILKKELDTLKDQRTELRGDSKRSPSPDTKRFLKENTKLQLEIQNKLKTIDNVVDMLNGIIGEEAQGLVESDESPERKRKSRSPAGKKFNYVYYDPEMHWCRVCNEFPPTAKDYLNHLHSAAHQKMAAQHMEAPWHSVTGANEGFPNYPAATTKRTPIRGLQFFVPSTAWYCKLCDQFIGDLHCASAHLKSVVHSKNYTNFVEQNPHWETDWMSDRQKAFENVRSSHKSKTVDEKPSHYTAHTITFSKDGFHTKRPKKSPSPTTDDKKKKKKKEKKKRKRDSSSSSSDNESSDSDAAKKKKTKAKKIKEINSKKDEALEHWMSNIKTDRLSDHDRKLLDNIKTRIKKERESPRRADHERPRPDAPREQHRKNRESSGHSTNTHAARERRSASRERRWDRRDKREHAPDKKTEVKKMPFIGKMPVYKHLGKAKTEEQKKEEQRKKEEEEETAKKRLEMDAEIQKKVAEFKDNIAKAQLERQKAAAAPAPQLPPPSLMSIAVPKPPQPALPKDFQEALDIIFPAEQQKPDVALPHPNHTSILGMPPPLVQPFPLGLVQFPFNSPMFPQAQLYDSHVPLITHNKRQNNRRNNNQKQPAVTQPAVTQPTVTQPSVTQPVVTQPAVAQSAKENGDALAKKKEEMDDLAMLGIDASDVGAGI